MIQVQRSGWIAKIKENTSSNEFTCISARWNHISWQKFHSEPISEYSSFDWGPYVILGKLLLACSATPRSRWMVRVNEIHVSARSSENGPISMKWIHNSGVNLVTHLVAPRSPTDILVQRRTHLYCVTFLFIRAFAISHFRWCYCQWCQLPAIRQCILTRRIRILLSEKIVSPRISVRQVFQSQRVTLKAHSANDTRILYLLVNNKICASQCAAVS